MSYNAGIPISGQTLGSSRPQVQGNFQVLFDTIAKNHVAMNATNAGKHTFVEMVAQLGDDTTQIQTGIVTHYSKLVGGLTEWFFQREGTGAVAGPSIQMSKGLPSATANGSTFLPGGLILKWGTFVATTVGTVVQFKDNVTLAPFPNAVFSVTLTSIFNSSTQATDIHLASTPTVNGFNGQSLVGGGITSYYMAIGN